MQPISSRKTQDCTSRATYNNMMAKVKKKKQNFVSLVLNRHTTLIIG